MLRKRPVRSVRRCSHCRLVDQLGISDEPMDKVLGKMADQFRRKCYTEARDDVEALCEGELQTFIH